MNSSFKTVVISNWMARILQAVLQIYIIRLLTTILNLDEYAMYTLLVALASWIYLSDFGLGVSLQNFISECRAKDKDFSPYIGNVTFLLIILFVILSAVFYAASIYMAPIYLNSFDIPLQSKVFLVYTASLMYLIIALSSIVYKIYYAIHKGYISNIMPAISTIITFILLILVEQYNTFLSHKLLYALIFSLIPQAIISFLCMFLFLKRERIFIVCDLSILVSIVKRSLGFWLFGLLATITLQADYFIASNFLNSNDIVLYNTLMRLYALGFFVYNSILLALWPIVNENINRGQIEQVLSHLKKYIPLGVLFIVFFSFAFYIFSPFVFSVLVKNTTLNVQIFTISLLCIYFSLRVWTDAFAMVLQSANILKPFWMVVPMQAALSVVCQVFFIKRFGLNGLLYGIIASFILTVAWYLPYQFKKQLIARRVNAKI